MSGLVIKHGPAKRILTLAELCDLLGGPARCPLHLTETPYGWEASLPKARQQRLTDDYTWEAPFSVGSTQDEALRALCRTLTDLKSEVRTGILWWTRSVDMRWYRVFPV